MKNLVMVFFLLVFFSSFAVKSASAATITRLGGIDIQAACDDQYESDTTAELYGKTVINWNCLYKNGKYIMSRLDIDLNKECRRVHGSSAYAAYTDFYKPYSWSCYVKK